MLRMLLRARGGLTLVEVMVTLMVSALLLGGAWQIYQRSMRAYQSGLQMTVVTQGARALLAVMSRDLQQVGAARSSLRGLDLRHPLPRGAAVDADRLELTLITQPAPDGASAPGLPRVQRIRYFLAPLDERGTLVLKRGTSSPGNADAERLLTLNKRLQGLNLRYFDGNLWYDEWQRDGLPRALEIAVVLQEGGRNARPRRFTTVIALE